MANWGINDNAANSVTWADTLVNRTANTTNQTALFGNTTMGAIVSKQTVGQVGLTAAETASVNGTHAGWNLRKVGTGSVVSFTIGAGGTGYANTDTINVAVTGTGAVNATATLTTNATGGITAVTITNAGSGYTTTAPTLVITTAGGTGATITARAGGRAGRVTNETLVAAGSLA